MGSVKRELIDRRTENKRVSTFLYGEGRRPLVFENVETDSAVAVDVGVVDARREVHLGRQ